MLVALTNERVIAQIGVARLVIEPQGTSERADSARSLERNCWVLRAA